MKAVKHIVVAVMLAVSSAAWADWVEVIRHDNATLYADPATIRKSGDRAKIWGLMDLKTADVSASGKPILSEQGQVEFDCKDERWRQLYSTQHSGQMGGGELTAFDNTPNNEWEPVAPRSGGEALWKVACGKA